MTAYSGTPLARKLGIKAGWRIFLSAPPKDYLRLVAPLPEGVRVVRRITSDTEIVHIFARKKAELRRTLLRTAPKLRDDGVVWVSWPKRASGVSTDVTEDVVRAVALPLGLVDIKVCSVDDTWSGLKLVIRKERRSRRGPTRR